MERSRIPNLVLSVFTSVSLLVVPSWAQDCNTNGVDDASDIAGGVSEDCNEDGLPDECQLIDTVLRTGSNSTDVVIPDDPAVTSTISMTVSGVITDTNVGVNIQHTWDSDLVVLVSHAGVTVELFSNVDGSGDNFTGTVLDENALTSITAGTPPFTGTFNPEGNLGDFNGQNTLGDWTLSIDDQAASDTGTLLAWSLAFQVVTTDNDCNSNGVPDECDIADGGSDDCNTNVVPDECELTDFPTSLFINPTDVLIPVDPAVTSTIDVVDPGTVSDVNVRVDIQHTFDGDLDVFIDHDGVTTELFTDVGGGGDNFTITILDEDFPNVIGSIGNNTAPFTGVYNPEGDLDLFDGQDQAGTWTLTVDNDFTLTGTLLSWTLFLERVESNDCNSNGVPDECEDCNTNGQADVCDIDGGGSPDCNGNGVPDECEFGIPAFADAVDYGVGAAPRGVVAGDLDRDGDNDLVVANEVSDTVSRLYNSGDGTFAAAVAFAAGDAPFGLALGDVDGDLDLDVAVANFASDNVSILKNSGGGSFAAAVNFAAGDGPAQVALADFDGDDDLDLAVANFNSDNVSILFNNGAGAFGAPFNEAVGDLPFSVAAGDLDNDGDVDLATAEFISSTVSILLNNGFGGFVVDSVLMPGSGPVTIAMGDLDGDCDLDLATGNQNTSDVSVFLNNGGANFATAVNYPVGGSGGFGVAIGDTDGDDDLDLAVTVIFSDVVSILRNNGDGGFSTAVTHAVGGRPWTVAAQDLNGDLLADLAVANIDDDDVSVLLNETQLPSGADCNTNGIPDDCENEDCNGNGLLDACEIEDQTLVPTADFVSTPGINFDDLVETTDTMTVADGASFHDLNVDLVVTHIFMGDTEYWLDKDGVTADLMFRRGGASADCDILFDDEATALPEAPLFGTFLPHDSLDALSLTCDQAGDWTIHCLDTFSGSGTGTLNQWSLHFSQLQSASPDCNSNGVPDDCDLTGGTSQDCNGSGLPDECELCDCLDLVFLIDTTGSRSPAFENAVAAAGDLLEQAEAGSLGDLRVGLITFKDDVTVQHALTTSIDAVQAAIAGLSASSGLGLPEASDEALREMLSDTICSSTGDFNTAFRPECAKIAILVTDALPGGCDDTFTLGVDDVNAHQRAVEAAGLGVKIVAVYTPTDAVDPVEVAIMTDYATTTGGLFAQVAPDGTGILDALAGVFDCGDSPEEDCNTNGIPDECDGFGGGDCNSNGVLDECEFGVLEPTNTLVVLPGLTFPDNVETTHAIDIADSVAFDDVNIDLVVTHSFMGDTEYWVDKDGTSVNLMTGVGGSSNDCDILFDDEAAGFPDVPLFGTFKPEEPLSTFDAGGDQAGTWTIHCLDTFAGFGTGVLEQWSLHFSRFTGCSWDNGSPDGVNGYPISEGGAFSAETADDFAAGLAPRIAGATFSDIEDADYVWNGTVRARVYGEEGDMISETEFSEQIVSGSDVSRVQNGVLFARPRYDYTLKLDLDLPPDGATWVSFRPGSDDVTGIAYWLTSHSPPAFGQSYIRVGGPWSTLPYDFAFTLDFGCNDCNTNGTPDDCEFEDCNTNGIADICDIANGTATNEDANDIPDECEPPEVCPAVFTPELEWSWTSSGIEPTSLNVMMTPAVIDITNDGIPDVIFGSTPSLGGSLVEIGHLRALNGDDGTEIFTIDDPTLRVNTCSSVAAGDIDLDGLPEIIACDESGVRLIAFEHDGAFKWRSPILENVNWGAACIADLNNDGTPEIVIGRQALDNAGNILWTGAGGRGSHGGVGAISVVADVDLNGDPNVVAGNTVYKPNGTILWQNAMLGDGLNAIGNFDGDNFAEIVLVSGGTVSLLEHTGAIKWGPIALPGGGTGGPPTVADYDGDGEPEIGVAGASRYAVFETDGSVKWAAVTQDGSSNVTGSSVFNFDGDACAEVVYRDELKLRIYRGEDGFVLFETPSNSCTWYEGAVVADVDADGHAEIVICANTNCGFGPLQGMFVYGDDDEGWVPTRRIWNQHAYHITNVNEDGTIPTFEQNNWLIYNNYRQNLSCEGFLAGDSDCDAAPYQASDVPAFVTALLSQPDWEAAYDCSYFCVNDINGDGAVDGDDIQDFVDALFP